MSVFELVVVNTWTVLSAGAVILAFWAAYYAKREAKETKEERAYFRANHAKNGRLVLAEQQASQAIKLLWAHRGVYFHQALFLGIGLFTLFSPTLPEPEQLPTIQSIVVPLGLLGAQFVIVGVQVLLFLVTREHRIARKAWSAKEEATEQLQESVDEGVEIGKDVQRKVTEMQERGQSDQPLEQTDRHEGKEHRGHIDEALEADTELRRVEREADRAERKQERKEDREERASEAERRE